MLTLDINLPLEHFTLACQHQLSSTGITGLLGASGSGKTSLLRVIAGLTHQASGQVSLNGQLLLDSHSNHFIKPHQREVGFVFQDDRLFPHLSVRDNLFYGANNKNSQEFFPLIDQAGISHLLDTRTTHLSAGERQRVALLRAVFARPKLLLLDEPLAHLDTKASHLMIALIKELNLKLNLPMVYISHDHFEIQQLADEVLVLEQGKIIQCGDVHQVMNNLSQSALHDYPVQTSLELIVNAHHETFGLTELALPQSKQHQPVYIKQAELKIGTSYRFFIKASDIAICLNEPTDSSMVNKLPANIVSIKEVGTLVYLKARLKNHSQEFNLSISKFSRHKLNIQNQSNVYLQFKASALSYL